LPKDDDIQVNTRVISIRLSAILMTLLGCLLILEILVRLLIPQSDLRLGKGDLFRYEPNIGFEGIPNAQGVFATRLQGSIVYTRLLQLLGIKYKKARGFLN
jgi:hypothetical protein